MKDYTKLKAHEIIAAGWCQNVYATDKEGNEVDAYDPEACKFCVNAAIALKNGHHPQTRPDNLADEIKLREHLDVRNGYHTAQWNNRSTQAEVVATLKELDI